MASSNVLPAERKEKKERDPYKSTKQMIAGGCAGAVSKTLVSPFERVKILCQNGKTHGLIHTFQEVYQREGFWAYWKGNNANVLRVIPNRALLFSSNDFFKEQFAHYSPGLSKHWVSILTGSLAGATAVASTYPLDVVRGRMGGLLGDTRYRGIFSTLMISLKEEGVRGWFRGIGPTLFASLPYEGIKFGSYDALLWMIPTQTDKIHTGWYLFCGGIAGAVAGTATYPLDTVRRRMQMQGTEVGQVVYKSSVDCAVKMIQTEGAKSLWAGVIANFWRVAPATAFQFAAYEAFKKVLKLET